MCRAVCHLLVQREECDAGIEGFPRLGRQSNDFEASGVDLFRELVDSDIGRRTDEDLAGVHLCKVVDNRGGRHGLARTRGPLNEADRLLENAFDSIHLRMIELG